MGVLTVPDQYVGNYVETQNTQTPVDMQNVETQNFASLQQPDDQPQNKFGSQSQNFASLHNKQKK